MMRIRLVSWREGTVVVMEGKGRESRAWTVSISIAGSSAPMRPIVGSASEDWQ
jgi:hypothetical protein